MPAWLPLPKLLPSIATSLATMATTAAPFFTKRKAFPAENQSELIQQQIAELQTVASQTDDRVRDLATQLKDALAAIEQSAFVAAARLKRIYFICIGSVCVAVLALVVAIAALALVAVEPG